MACIYLIHPAFHVDWTIVGPDSVVVWAAKSCTGDAFLGFITSRTRCWIFVVVIEASTFAAWEFFVFLNAFIRFMQIKAATTDVARDQWDKTDTVATPIDSLSS